MDVSVIVPTLNGGPRFRTVVEALRRQESTFEVEVVVVDSGSTDSTRETAREAGFQVLNVKPQDFDHGLTRDRAAKESRGEFLVFLVQDAVPQGSDWLQHLVEAVRADDEVAGAFSRQLPIPGGNPILDERLRGWIAGKDEHRRSQLTADRPWDSLTPFERLELVAFDNVCSCLRRSRWEEHPLGPRPFGEDIAWATWAIREGHAVVFEPRSAVEHSHDRGPWHEARRIYCDHRNLNDLLGMVTVPSLSEGWQNQKAAREHYLQVLAGADLAPEELRRRQRWARRYALGEMLAQWLAPKVNRARARGLLGWLDRRIRRGI